MSPLLSSPALSRFGAFCLVVGAVGVMSACGSTEEALQPTTASSPPAVTIVDPAYFYVAPTGSNASDGQAADTAWQTLQYAVDQLSPGDTLNVAAGIYSARMRLEGDNDSGTVSAPITIMAHAGAIIDGSTLTPSGSDGLLSLIDVSHVVVSGFEIRNFKTAVGFNISDAPMGVRITGDVLNVELRDLTIHTIENNSTCSQNDSCGPGANGIGVFGNTLAGIRDIRLIGNDVSNCKTSSSEAFVLNGNVDGFVVRDNYVHDNNNIGLDFIGLEGICQLCSDEMDRARNGLVQNNRVMNNSTQNLGGNPWYGDEVSAGGIYVDGGVNLIIDGNFVSGNDLGIEIASEAAGMLTTDILVTNNIVAHNNQVGLALGGYNEDVQQSGGGGVSRVQVLNNSFYQNRGWGRDLTLQYRVSDTRFSNNAVFARGYSNDGLITNVDGDEFRNGLSWENNLWWGDVLGGTAPVDPITSRVADPLFSNVGTDDFSPQSGSPLIDGGVASGADVFWDSNYWATLYPPDGIIPVHGKTDQAGHARQVGQIDIGAIELETR